MMSSDFQQIINKIFGANCESCMRVLRYTAMNEIFEKIVILQQDAITINSRNLLIGIGEV